MDPLAYADGMAYMDHREGPLDPVATAAELEIPSPRDPKRIEGGSGTDIWRVETDAGPVAVRVFPASHHGVAQRERDVLTIVRGSTIRVPAILAAGAAASAGGRPVTVLEWCEGTTMLDRLVAQPRDARWLGDLLGRTQAAIHRLAPPVAWVRDSTDRLLHLDLHPANVIVAGRDVSGVLDWVNSTAGDPRRDVARTYSMLVVDPTAAAFRREQPDAVRTFRRSWWGGYIEAAGPLVGLGTFIAEAGMFMGVDLAGRLDRGQRTAIEQWTERWRQRATRAGA
jgi:aminoglycoside phosphotransferase (APT) family kinase protein